MSHIFFFSYANENWYQPGLDDFYDDLCRAVAPNAKWKYDNDNISFRDHEMQLGEEWKPAIANALQESAVLVCIVSEAYFSKEFCGQEFFIFDQRRRQGLAPNATPPDVILPVIWAPLEQNYPNVIGDLQADQAGMHKDYFSKGLLRLKTLNRRAYQKCVANFADAISETWKQYCQWDPFDPMAWKCTIPPGPAAQLGPSIPNAFAGGDWKEAAGPEGWLHGPEVANFVFAAGVNALIPQPRYGVKPGNWTPYLPPPKTVSEYAVQAVRKRRSFKFREIPITPQIGDDLAEAKERNNLTLLVADPQSLALKPLSYIHSHDALAWEGSAVLLPCDDIKSWQDQAVQAEVQKAFPKHILSAGTAAPGSPAAEPLRIPSPEELQRKLESKLDELRSAVVKKLTEGLPVTGVAPPQVAATPGAPVK